MYLCVLMNIDERMSVMHWIVLLRSDTCTDDSYCIDGLDIHGLDSFGLDTYGFDTYCLDTYKFVFKSRAKVGAITNPLRPLA